MTRTRNHLPLLIAVAVAILLAVILLGHAHHRTPKPFLPYPVFTQTACDQAVTDNRFQWFDYRSGGGWEPILCGLPPDPGPVNWPG